MQSERRWRVALRAHEERAEQGARPNSRERLGFVVHWFHDVPFVSGPRCPGCGSAWSFGILDASGGFPETHSGESPAPFRVGSFLDADIWCHGLGSALCLGSREEWNQDGTDWSVGWPDQFAADDHHGFDFREDQMRISEDWIPNQSLQTTPRFRLGWHVGRHWRGVSELGRSVSSIRGIFRGMMKIQH